jgi:rhodanese-related sulfurtransferase
MPVSYGDLVNEARSRIKEIDVETAAEAIEAGGCVVLDVRESQEHEQGTIEGALRIPRGVAEMQVPRAIPDPSTRIICYCAGGGRSALVADAMRRMGYTNIESMVGGMRAWVQSGRSVAR